MQPRAYTTIALASMIALTAASQISGCGESTETFLSGKGKCPPELDDANPCTADSCPGVQVSHAALPNNTPCALGMNGGRCQAGTCLLDCVANSTACTCQGPADCPMSAECQTWTCAGGTCTADYHDGLPIATQTDGDCKAVVCDGMGDTRTEPADDIPTDGDPCTTDGCNAGNDTHIPKSEGDACEGQLGVCTATGDCVECLQHSDCGDPDLRCVNNVCFSCTDGVKNGDEVDADCGGSCPKCDDGVQCTSKDACASDYCVDGVCCNNGCTIQCLTCSLPGAEGQCQPIPTGQDDPSNSCGMNMACKAGEGCKGLPGAACVNDSDCISNMCMGSPKTCT